MAKKPRKKLGDFPDPLPDPIPPVPPVPPPCPCPEFCADKASGTMAFCEDGVWTALPPPVVNSTLKYNAATGTVYWNPD